MRFNCRKRWLVDLFDLMGKVAVTVRFQNCAGQNRLVAYNGSSASQQTEFLIQFNLYVFSEYSTPRP